MFEEKILFIHISHFKNLFFSITYAKKLEDQQKLQNIISKNYSSYVLAYVSQNELFIDQTR